MQTTCFVSRATVSGLHASLITQSKRVMMSNYLYSNSVRLSNTTHSENTLLNRAL